MLPGMRHGMPQQKRQKTQQSSRSECPTCRDKAHILNDTGSGDRICAGCGYVLEISHISDEQEWRDFSVAVAAKGRSDDKSRVGEIVDSWFGDSSITSTTIGGPKWFQNLHSAAEARMIEDEQFQQQHGTDKAASGEVAKSNRAMKNAFNALKNICNGFNMSYNVIERAKEIIKFLSENNELPTRNTTANSMAILYLACRDVKATRTIKEFVDFDRTITEKELGRAVSRLKKAFSKIGTSGNSDAGSSFSTRDVFGNNSASLVNQLVCRFCAKLQLSIHVTDVAEHVSTKAAALLVSAHRPNTLAAAAIWFVVHLCCPYDLSQPRDMKKNDSFQMPSSSDVALITGCSEVAFKSLTKDLVDLAEQILPAEFHPKNPGGIERMRETFDKKRRGPLQQDMAK